MAEQGLQVITIGLFVFIVFVVLVIDFFRERSKYKKRLKNHNKGKTIEFN